MALYLTHICLDKINNHDLFVNKTLKGSGLAVTPSVYSVVGVSSIEGGENVNACNNVAINTKILLFANTSPIQRCLPVNIKLNHKNKYLNINKRTKTNK